MNRTPSINTYVIPEDEECIICLGCHLISHNPNDVENRYCPHCHVFHDHIWPPARADWIANTKKLVDDSRLEGVNVCPSKSVDRNENFA